MTSSVAVVVQKGSCRSVEAVIAVAKMVIGHSGERIPVTAQQRSEQTSQKDSWTAVVWVAAAPVEAVVAESLWHQSSSWTDGKGW